MRKKDACPMACLTAILLIRGGIEGQNLERAVVETRPEGDAELIEAGTFEMGTDASELEGLRRVFGMKSNRVFIPEIPRHTVRVDAFYMDKREVTNAQFKAFVDAQPQWRPDRIPARYHNGNYLKHWEGDRYPPGKGEHPVIYVSWYAAVAYAQWAGKRLPTEAEWEYAARGGLARKQYPWGDDAVDTLRANYAASGTGEAKGVGSYPPNGYGLYDMAGNV